ncbi:MAG: hypothetical protein IKA25_03700 [Alphaproteobacteria bacterium]|nr:hypothetical protein [Alphaproteobacteria bacterium]
MFYKRTRIIVGMTTLYNEYLGISIPGLARLGKKITLIIYNDNPDTKVKKSYIRKLGYRGKLYVVNGGHNMGQLRARLAIVDFVRKKKLKADWFVFVDDDDILTNVVIPNVSENNFAIIQNMAVIRTRLIDVLRVARDATNYTIDNENIYLVRPHVGLAGTLVRYSAILRMADVMNNALQSISDVDESLTFRSPVDMMMWSALNIIARHDNERATPIYMDTINYIATDVDTCPTKYGMKIQPAKNPTQQISRAIARYDAAIRATLRDNNAAPTGQELDA